jgi:hypothetical protein
MSMRLLVRLVHPHHLRPAHWHVSHAVMGIQFLQVDSMPLSEFGR